jgi:hypothetical protein
MGEQVEGVNIAPKETFLMPTSEVQKHGITNDDIKKIQKDLKSPEGLQKNIDLKKTVGPLLKQRGIDIDVLEREKGKKVTEDFLVDSLLDPNFMGEPRVIYDGKKGRIHVVSETPDGERIPIYDKKGKLHGVDTKDVRNYVERIGLD